MFSSTDVSLRIDNTNRAPVLDTPNHAVRLGEQLRFFIEATDPDLATTLNYDAADLPEGATVNHSTGEIVWTPGPGQDGEYLIRVFASDGQTTSSQIVVLLAAFELPKPNVSLVLTPSFPSPPGAQILVAAIADSLSSIASIVVTLDGQPVSIDAEGRGEIILPAPGRYEVVATATDLDGSVGVDTKTVKVRDLNDVDAPTVDLAVPEFSVIANGRILGTVNDVNLDEWTLEIKRFGDRDFRTIAIGHDIVIDGVLATLDVQDLPNDFYVLRLSARDIGRRLARTETIVEVFSETKRNLVLAETDLVVTVGSVEVEVTRQFDSLERDRSDRVGYGWQLLGRDINLRASVPPTGHEAQGLYSAYRDQTRLYLTSPTGDELGFVFNPQEHTFPGLTYYTATWQPIGGNPTGWSLESTNIKLMRGGRQYFDLASGYPYNPMSPLFEGTDFILKAPDGNSYDIDAKLGIIAKTNSAGQTVYLGDNGIVAAGGQSVQFITDAKGRLQRLIGPDGEVVQYEYDVAGDLVSVRKPQSGQTTRYGYSSRVDHLLETVVEVGTGGLSFQYSDQASPTVAPISAYLGAAANFVGEVVHLPLGVDESGRVVFSVHQSEIDSTDADKVLVRVIASTTGGLQVNVPQIAGLTPLSSHMTTDRAEAVYAISSAGLYQVEVTGTGGIAGNVDLEVLIAGDINSDLLVDGLDSELQVSLLGRSVGTPGFNPLADIDGSGTIDIVDRQLLFRNAGFIGNVAPVANPVFGVQLTHTDLAVQFELDDAVRDSDGDSVYYQIVGVQNGSAELGPNGKFVTFVPDLGYFGPATITLLADDGFNLSEPITVDINVSGAELLGIDIINRRPRLDVLDHVQLQVIGQFADQSNVPLIGNYVSYISSNQSVASVNEQGVISAASEGYTAMVVARGVYQAATAVAVGTPGADDPSYPGDDIFVYPMSLTLPIVAGQRRFRVETLGGEDLSLESEGTLYILGDSRVIDMTDDGFATSSSIGMTTLTIINGGGERVVPINVIQPQIGTATFGTEGGILQSDEGVLLQIPPGALPADVAVSLTSFVDTVAPEFDAVFDVGASFTLDLGGAVLESPAQVAVPVPASFGVGETVYFFQKQTITLEDGSTSDIWLVMETGVVGADGIARTTSPPYPGFSAGAIPNCKSRSAESTG